MFFYFLLFIIDFIIKVKGSVYLISVFVIVIYCLILIGDMLLYLIDNRVIVLKYK